MIANAHTEKTVNATDIEKTTAKAQTKIAEETKEENIEQENVIFVASLIYSVVTVTNKLTDNLCGLSVFYIAIFHLLC